MITFSLAGVTKPDRLKPIVVNYPRAFILGRKSAMNPGAFVKASYLFQCNVREWQQKLLVTRWLMSSISSGHANRDAEP
jgi:hypothetical protein